MTLVLYPEGERSMDGTPRTFKKGAAILSIHLQVPIVPAAIEGFYQAWPRNRKFRGFTPLKMVFGNPIFPPPESQASEEAYEKLTAVLKARIEKMWEELRQAGDAPDSGAGAGSPPAKGINAAVPA
jgi:1-acyl-sn-glycerol-3-phosphate acyltransferase